MGAATFKVLSPHALDVLESLARFGPKPRQEINEGVNYRFEREGLTECVMQPSPYASHKGKLIRFTRITDAGRAHLPTPGAPHAR